MRIAVLVALAMIAVSGRCQHLSEEEQDAFRDIGKVMGAIEQVKRAKIGTEPMVLGKYRKIGTSKEKAALVDELEADLARTKKEAQEPFARLPELDPSRPMQTGQRGILRDRDCEVINVVSDTELIVRNIGEVVWVSNVDASNIVDDSTVRLSYGFEVAGKKNYTNVAGGSRTVWHLKAVSFKEEIEEATKLWIAANTREWTIDGKPVKGRLLEVDGSLATILTEGNETVKARSTTLSGDDRSYIKVWEEPRRKLIREGYVGYLR